MEDIENKIENIYDFIEDLYDLRKNSIADEGEFGTGNLVFKEFRNLGYLDYLKNLMKELKSKKLSLESVNEDKLCESKEDIQRFIDKFGEDLYDLFVNSKDRLKNADISTDMVWHTKNTSVEDMKGILYNLRSKVKKSDDSFDLTEIPGNHNYLGSANGYDVYEPLDAEASMALGVGTGWCTTGRYGHAGDLNFKPSLKDAEKHWKDYTSKGIRFFYFLQNGIGKYALALYPKVLRVDRKINPNTILKKTNCELFDQYDKLDYKDLERLPLNLIKDEIVIKKNDLETIEIKLKSGKKAYLVVYNRNPLVVGWESLRVPQTTWYNLQETILKWYDDEFPDELKEQYPRDTLHSLCVENLVSGKNVPEWAVPIADKSRAFRLEYFPNVSYNKNCTERQYYDWYWLENAYSDSSDGACVVEGNFGNINIGWNSLDGLRPAFFLGNRKTKTESLTKSKEDIQKFIDKFGQELYDLFVKSEKTLKDTGESVDMSYHIENTSVDDMRKLLDDIQAKTRLSENVKELESKLKSLGVDTSLFFNISKESSQDVPEKAINEFDAIKTKIEVLGKYGNPEISYIVWGIDLEEAKRLGLALKQNSILATTIENGKLLSVSYEVDDNGEYREKDNTNQIVVSDSEEGMGNDNYTKVDDGFYYSLILPKKDGQTQKNDGFSQVAEVK